MSGRVFEVKSAHPHKRLNSQIYPNYERAEKNRHQR